jgi:hypothetical protein
LWQAAAVEMDELLIAMDRTSANLVKLEELWCRGSTRVSGFDVGSATLTLDTFRVLAGHDTPTPTP